jgi:diaminohydroxyphosphoribosylaminopyrimidine deaminase/5-amino-6-(5-phosphoribosylamino)uracil reductase
MIASTLLLRLCLLCLTWSASLTLSSGTGPGSPEEESVIFSFADRLFMRRAIALAARAQGHTRPNPCVGCVIVDASGQVIGEGWHERSGQPHAEVRALREAVSVCAESGTGERDIHTGERQSQRQTAGGTAYVSLEPCNHYGRTPPCTLALLK